MFMYSPVSEWRHRSIVLCRARFVWCVTSFISSRACCCIYGNQGKTKSPFTACGNKLTPVRPRISHFSMKIPRRPLFLLQPELLWPMLLFWVQLILLTEIWLVSKMSNIRIWYENRKPIYHRIQYYETRRKFTGIWNYRSISTFDFVLKYLFFFHKI